MLKIDMITEKSGVVVHYHKGDDGGWLRFTRRDGTTILHIRADYADERALSTAAYTLNFLFKTSKHGKTDET